MILNKYFSSEQNVQMEGNRLLKKRFFPISLRTPRMPDTISSETSTENSSTFLEDISDHIEYLEEEYSEADMDSFLALKEKLNQTLSKMNVKNQQKVRQNFSKFVKCRDSIHHIHQSNYIQTFRTSLEQIQSQIKKLKERSHRLDTSMSEKLNTENIDKNYVSDEHQEYMSLEQQHKYRNLMDLEKNLINCMKYKDYDEFVKKYLKVKKIKDNPELLGIILKKCKPLIVQFQNILLLELEKSLSTENIHYLELYKKINGAEASKIDNTLLIFLKKYLNERTRLSQVDNCLIYMLRSCELSSGNDFIHQKMIVSLIEWMKNVSVIDETRFNQESDISDDFISETTSYASLDLTLTEKDEYQHMSFSISQIRSIEHMIQKFYIFNNSLKALISPMNFKFYYDRYDQTKIEISQRLLSNIDIIFQNILSNKKEMFDSKKYLKQLLRSLLTWLPLQIIKNKIYECVERYSDPIFIIFGRIALSEDAYSSNISDAPNININPQNYLDEGIEIHKKERKNSFQQSEKLHLDESPRKKNNSGHCYFENSFSKESALNVRKDRPNQYEKSHFKQNNCLQSQNGHLQYTLMDLQIYHNRMAYFLKHLKKCNISLKNTLDFSKIDRICDKSRRRLIIYFLSKYPTNVPEEFLMLVLNLKQNYPIDSEILHNMTHPLKKSNIIRYFLSGLMKQPEPELDEHEQMVINELQIQFGALK